MAEYAGTLTDLDSRIPPGIIVPFLMHLLVAMILTIPLERSVVYFGALGWLGHGLAVAGVGVLFAFDLRSRIRSAPADNRRIAGRGAAQLVIDHRIKTLGGAQ